MSTTERKTTTKGASADEGGRTINLDQARVARAEKIGEAPTITLSGKTFTLPPEMPFLYAVEASRGNIDGALRVLLGDQADDFFALGLSVTDVEEIAEQSATVYGIAEGE